VDSVAAPFPGSASAEVLPLRYVGRRVRRKEDLRLTTGQGRYVADIRLPGIAAAAILRSTAAHARITRIDTKAAREMDGVLAVYTGADVEGRVGPIVEAARKEVQGPIKDRVPAMVVKSCPMPVLALEEVFWAGQPVAVVVAENRYVAEDALERIEVDYEDLPAVPGAAAALSTDAPVLHPELGDNVAAHFVVSSGDVEMVFRDAELTLSHRFEMGRMAGNAMETRGILASWDPATQGLTVWCANARPHLVRTNVCEAIGLPYDSVRVIGPDMGGSFGTGMFSEEVLIPFLARELDRPVRWIEDRRENLMVTRHARDQVHDVEVAFDRSGKILALRDRYSLDVGAYNQYAITVAYNSAAHLRGQFAIDVFEIEATIVLTTKAPVTPVRGAGRPEAVFAMDRMMDLVADRLGLDPVEVRRRNLIAPEQMPYDMRMPYRDGVDIVYDRADFPGQLQAALDLFGYESWRDRQATGRREGRRIGIGVSSYMEGSGFGPYEGAVVRVDAHGHVSVYTGAKPHGQSLETTLAQICADQLGVAFDDVTVRAGDTAFIAHGIGTFASRSAVTAGGAVGTAAGELRKNILGIAGDLLEADPLDLEFEDGRIFPTGAPERSVSLAQVAEAAAPGPRSKAGHHPGLEAQHYFVPPTVTFGSGTHVVAVEVDEETGFVNLLRYVTVDDCGQMINPTVVEGQIHGGVAHGIGNALFEECVYDEHGQLLTGTYMDYLVPTAAEVPAITVGHQEFLSERNPFGIKGVGEGGAVSPPAAIANAVVDALRPLHIVVDRMPLHPEQLLRMIQDARREPEAPS
jgi:aerobic carbon-monoxide dehydrogenase large subunit